MLRRQVRDLLYGNDALRGMLAGGMYPSDTYDVSLVSRDATPLAFDAHSYVLPTMLVQDDGIAPAEGTDRTGFAFFRLVLWQQKGRTIIDAASLVAWNVLNGARVNVGGLWVYQMEYLGDGPAVPDPGLQDAEQGSSRWRAAILRGG